MQHEMHVSYACYSRVVKCRVCGDGQGREKAGLPFKELRSFKY